MTDTFEFDMDLLWRAGQIRTAIEALDGDGETRDVVDAVVHARARVDDGGSAARLLDALAAAWSDAGADAAVAGSPLARRTTTAVEALEEAFSSDDAEAGRALVEAALEAVTAGGDGGSPQAPELPDLEVLNALAARMIQVDDRDRDALGELAAAARDALGEVADELRTGADAALDLLAEGLEGSRWSDRRRALADDGLAALGQALEALMLHVEMEGVDAPEPVAPEAAGPEAVEPEPVTPEAVEPEAIEPEVEGSAPADAPTPTPRPIPESADPDLLDDFVTEGYDHLDMAESALLTLEERPDDEEAVNVVFRAFHTVKGVAGFLELSEVADFAHHAESVLSRVRDGSLVFSPPMADLTLRSSDVIRGLLDGIRAAMGTDDDMAIPRAYGELLSILSDEERVSRLSRGEPLLLSEAAAVPDEESEGTGDAPGASKEADEREASVRVRTGRLDRLLDLVGELVVSHSMVAEDPQLQGLTELQRKVVRSEKILRELQDLTTGMRMVPMRPAFRKVARVVRDVSRRSGKSVNLVTAGEDTELDRTMVDVLADPLVHMVRNAVDHGIETPEERRAAGKDPEGTLELRAYQTGGNVVVEIRDDGRGLDRDRILAKAIERGVVDSDRGLSDDEIHNLVFAAGFSTAAEVTDISGRGVGMDVVRKSVESLRGRVEITSTPGEGSCFSIHLPLTLAITDGMLMGVGSERYIIPIVKIHSSLRPGPDDLTTVQGRGELVKLHEELLPVVRLHRLYEVEGARTDPSRALLVIVGEGTRRFALMVDEILGQQQFVVKAMTGHVSHAPGVAGGAILGDGRVGLILDPDELLNLSRRGPTLTGAGAAA